MSEREIVEVESQEWKTEVVAREAQEERDARRQKWLEEALKECPW